MGQSAWVLIDSYNVQDPKSTSLANSWHWSPGPTGNGCGWLQVQNEEIGRTAPKAEWQTLLKYPATDTQHKDSFPCSLSKTKHFHVPWHHGLGVQGGDFSSLLCLTSVSSLGMTFRDFSEIHTCFSARIFLLDFNLMQQSLPKISDSFDIGTNYSLVPSSVVLVTQEGINAWLFQFLVSSRPLLPQLWEDKGWMVLNLSKENPQQAGAGKSYLALESFGKWV